MLLALLTIMAAAARAATPALHVHAPAVDGGAPPLEAAAPPPFYCGPSWRPGFITRTPTKDPFAPASPQSQATWVSTARSSWAITLKGTADMDSTLTPSAGCKNISFQPNVEV